MKTKNYLKKDVDVCLAQLCWQLSLEPSLCMCSSQNGTMSMASGFKTSHTEADSTTLTTSICLMMQRKR